MNDHFVTILVFFAIFSTEKVGILDLFWLAACRRRFFFGPNSVSRGKGPEEHCLEESLQSVMWWDLTFGLLSLEEKEEAKKTEKRNTSASLTRLQWARALNPP